VFTKRTIIGTIIGGAIIGIGIYSLITSFGLQSIDLDETFGKVVADTNLEGTIELVGRMNGPYATHEFTLRVSLSLAVKMFLYS